MSELEESFLSLWKALARECTLPDREVRFHPTRRWRFDFAWPIERVAVEIEGGVWSRGGHTRGKVFIANCDKYNAAAVMGWKVLRYTTNHLRERPVQTIEEIKAALAAAE